MTTSPSTNADYLAELQALTPAGGAFPTDDASAWTSFLTGLAQAFEDVDNVITTLLTEIFPDTTNELLPDWERVAGLPDKCSGLGATLQIRRQNLIFRLTNAGGQSKQYFIDIAAQLGYTIEIVEYVPFQVGISSVTDPLADATWRFAWQVRAPLNSIQYFRAGQSSAGEPLAYWSNVLLECVINELKPAHTVVDFAYS